MDYLDVSYDEKKTPFTDYPSKLAKFVFDRAELGGCLNLLDVGAGRFEMAKGFDQLGLDVTGLDSSLEAKSYANKFKLAFVHHELDPPNPLPFADKTFDVVFSKSFIEHILDPIFFVEECHRILKPKGKFIVLTPDWEANTKIFYDDVTHVKPFTTESLEQILQLCNFANNQVFRFRQLPLTWKFKSLNLLSAIVAPFVPVRTRNKFFRWSRELMLFGVGIRGEE